MPRRRREGLSAHDRGDEALLGSVPEGEEDTAAPFTNFKGALQEAARTFNLPAPRYSVVSEQGPAHARTFIVEVRLGNELAEQAQGDSKKSAGQMAAQAILQRLLERAE